MPAFETSSDAYRFSGLFDAAPLDEGFPSGSTILIRRYGGYPVT
jgi:hypothetical protein